MPSNRYMRKVYHELRNEHYRCQRPTCSWMAERKLSLRFIIKGCSKLCRTREKFGIKLVDATMARDEQRRRNHDNDLETREELC